jgi:adenosylcobinamide-phosphate synthase
MDFLLILALALLIDFALGEIKPVFLHPVSVTWRLGSLFKRFASRGFIYGLIAWLLSVLPLLISLTLVYSYCSSLPFGFLIQAILLKSTFSINLLDNISGKSEECLQKGDLQCHKYWAQHLVRRDVYKLDRGHVNSALVESLVESLVDGIISPLFYYFLFGFPGSLLQRLANTMDSLYGYKYYSSFGTFSAGADTIMNFLPSRVSSIFLAISFKILGFEFSPKLWERGISVNSIVVISTAANCLNVILEKPGEYSYGKGSLPSSQHVRATRSSVFLSTYLFIIASSMIHIALFNLLPIH